MKTSEGRRPSVLEVPVYVVWWSDGEQDFEPVYAAALECDAADYILDHEDDHGNVYVMTKTYSQQPTLETMPEEDEQ